MPRSLLAPVYWAGTTYLEEHEIAPTYEVFVGGCPQRCVTCSLPACRDGAGRLTTVAAAVEGALHPRVPGYRAVSFVGGEPLLHLPWIRAVARGLRAARPDVAVVLNTALEGPWPGSPHLGRTFHRVVACVHAGNDRCGAILGLRPGHPRRARRRVEALLRAGVPVILRFLALPGHLDCCLAPLCRWAAGLRGPVRVHVMTNYAPPAGGVLPPPLDRPLTDREAARARVLLPPEVPRPAAMPLPGWSPPPADPLEPEVPLEVAPDGHLTAPFVTASVLRALGIMDPALRPRLVYLEAPCPPT